MTTQPGTQTARPAGGLSRFWTALEAEWRPARSLPLNYERAIALAIFALAAFLRLITLGQDSLWVDEGYTLAAAELSYGHIFSVPFDTHPPLHFAVVKFFTGFLEGEWAVRLPSALFALASLVPAWLLARRMMGAVGGLVSLAVLALSYTHLVYANTGRDYALLVFFLFLAAYALQGFGAALLEKAQPLSKRVLGWAGLYGLAAAGGLYSHNTAILYLFILNAGLCAWVLVQTPRQAFRFILGLAGLHILPFLIWSPWLLVMLGTSGAFDWLHQMSPVEAATTLAATIGPNAVPAPLMGIFFIALLAGAALSVIRPGWSAAMIAIHLLLFPGFIWLMGYVYKPIYMERIILPALLGGALAIGYLAAHGRRVRLAGGLTGLALFASLLSAGAYVLRGDDATNVSAQVIQDWRGAVTAQTADEALIICDTFTWPVVHHYAGDRRVLVHYEDGVWDLTEQDWLDNYGRPVATRMLHAENGKPAWMTRTEIGWDETVTASPSLVFLKADILCNDGEPKELRERLAASGYRQESLQSWRGVSAERYVRD